VEREFYRMDNEIMNPPPQIHAPTDSVPATSSLPDAVHPEAPQPDTAHAPVDEPASTAASPVQSELALQHPPLDESEPGHPNYNREEKPADEAPPTSDSPSQKAG
ncbi:MAG: hypothetical protein JNK82_11320, partial [Myxococcaceae bacterium]|nr:hypothetical protein [Myxococcaceae bacterium]